MQIGSGFPTVSRQEYLIFVHKIVSEMLPQEVTAFELSSERIADQLFEQGFLQNEQAGSAGEFQFLDGAATVLEFVALMVGTFESIWKVIDRIKKLRSKDDDEKVINTWKVYLRERGLSESLTEDIINRFRSDMLRIVKIRVDE